MEATQEFFLRVIEEASQVDNGEILFKSLRTEKGIEIMEALVKVKRNTYFRGRKNSITKCTVIL